MQYLKTGLLRYDNGTGQKIMLRNLKPDLLNILNI